MAAEPNTTNPSRRSILSALAAIPCVMAPAAFAAISAPGDLRHLGQELARVHQTRLALPEDTDEAEQDALYERHWQLREQINAIEATSLTGLKVKGAAAEMALQFDTDCDCSGAGSFVDLARSMIADIQRLGA